MAATVHALRALKPQAGAALLLAMLTVALVAAVATQAFWQQWRGTETEAATRAHLQARWLLNGGLEWARVRLRQDALRGGADHLAEPWAVPIRNAPIGEVFAGAPGGAAMPAAIISLEIIDLQSRLNVLNLLEGPQLSPAWLAAFERLFATLGLPAAELRRFGENLRLAGLAGPDSGISPLPQHPAQLVNLGLAPATLKALLPFITVLPGRVPVNLNTASMPVLKAVLPDLMGAGAERLISLRGSQPLQSMAQANAGTPVEGMLSISSRFFEASVELDFGNYRMAEHALLQREGLDVRTLWHRRVAAAPR
ncbi:MAG: type II secretion system minor pseudopilin GspK [Pseudomonadota bacterium]